MGRVTSSAAFSALIFAVLLQCIAAVTPTPATTATLTQTANDLFASAQGITFGPGLIASAAIVGGVFVALWGYKLFRPVMFLSGFAVGSILGYMLAERFFNEETYFQTAAWIMFVVLGLIVGATVMSIWAWGVFLVGAAAGALLGFHVNTSFGYLIYPSSPETSLWICVIVLGLIGGFLGSWFERPALIVATSFFGAAAAVWGVGYFAGNFPNSRELDVWRSEAANGSFSYDLPKEWWYYLAGTIVFFILAVFFQFNKSALGVFHQNPKAKHANAAPADYATPQRGQPISHV
ncbi:hypothetical protein H257_04246 [Aphanomyces astaci]|uniref:Transmembrane protein 198 n=2 Tax=Aphanomyces astaci TaxID=112090 RepID=W4GV27_APHAT|nr:hypothetical protein H257_04246 [Aphanomyces astaci]ETV83537.1 hypothetical protein H257_04246 [Aphanomyces astaci]RHY03097.1 hypothetical protein DYB36_008214 [Aphanomyces astaci]RQM30409.1 hypothetical protein B5M09_010457 [Aphanomyces astaci]|eukprot:XP_009826967.1 hypothetical protein H257_04246 [Aphanomyces astaci]